MLIIIFIVLSLIQSPLSARTCKKSLDYSHIDNIELFYQQDHPQCLKGLLKDAHNQKFKSLKQWSNINEKMKILKLQPLCWQDFESIKSLVMDSKTIRESLKKLDQMSSKRKAKLSAWLSSQQNLLKSLNTSRKPRSIYRELRRAFPFIW